MKEEKNAVWAVCIGVLAIITVIAWHFFGKPNDLQMLAGLLISGTVLFTGLGRWLYLQHQHTAS